MLIQPFFVHSLFLFFAIKQVLGRPIFLVSNVNRAIATNDSSLGNFGSCSVPEIQFGTGFDNRKETSFEPVDKSLFQFKFCTTCN